MRHATDFGTDMTDWALVQCYPRGLLWEIAGQAADCERYRREAMERGDWADARVFSRHGAWARRAARGVLGRMGPAERSLAATWRRHYREAQA